jgi:hypothetical protein
MSLNQHEVNKRTDIISKIDAQFRSTNSTKNYDTMLVESEMIKKQQDTIFLISGITAVILVIVTFNIIKK